MDERDTAKAIDAQAAVWVARMDRGPLDAQAQAEMETWLAGDSRRRGALLRAEAAWGELGRARGLALPEETAVRPHRRRLLVGGGAIAAGLVAGLTGWGVFELGAGQRISTRRGEIRRVPLDDGSLLAMNTDTRVRVGLHARERRVELAEGEAWIQVAHDASRPLVVAAGEVQVRAVGTAFAVRRLDGGAEVQVTEGVVEAWSRRAPAKLLRLAQGDKAFISDVTGPAPSRSAPLEIDRRLAWREGEIVLDGDTLSEAVAEFNRHNTRRLVVDDPDLARQALVGRFRTTEPDTFARAVSVTTGARVTLEPEVIRLSRG